MANENDQYFSEQEAGVIAPDVEDIPQGVWSGVTAIIQGAVSNNWLAHSFPELCHDSDIPCGTNERILSDLAMAEIPKMQWPLHVWDDPTTFQILDVIEFFGRHVSVPKVGDYHQFFRHNHIIDFDKELGFSEYRAAINRLFRRNGIAFQIDDDGHIRRLLPSVIRFVMGAEIQTGDSELDVLIAEGVAKFKEPDLTERRLGLERLWDAWERLKTIRDPDKKYGWFQLRDEQFVEDHWRETVEEEAGWLTKIGNAYQIRHKEVGKHPIEDPRDIDYLFFRMYSLIYRLLRN